MKVSVNVPEPVAESVTLTLTPEEATALRRYLYGIDFYEINNPTTNRPEYQRPGYRGILNCLYHDLNGVLEDHGLDR